MRHVVDYLANHCYHQPMPRSARIDIPDLLQHVIVRGIERGDCLAWALMSNHFYRLIRPRQTRLSVFMRRLLTGYAVGFNLRHKRVGHLFQNRYKSIVRQEVLSLFELVRYIHLNPLRAGLVHNIDELGTYPWSGHSALMGKIPFEGQNTDEILSLFAGKKRDACRIYRQFVADGIERGRRTELVGVAEYCARGCDGLTLPRRSPELRDEIINKSTTVP